MTERAENPYESLERIFHEPNRLAIMSALCRAGDELAFNELKEECRLTDGNLSRHLKALEDASAVKIHKSFVGAKPRTTVEISAKGRRQFLEYLEALEDVLKEAAAAAHGEKKAARRGIFGKAARA